MKRTLMTLLLVVSAAAIYAQTLFVGSYNIRYANPSDVADGNGWEQRCPRVCGILNFEQPDIFGAQEVLYPQLQDMLRMLDGYAYIGVGRDDGKQEGEYAAIFYKKDNIQMLDHGQFWLSEDTTRPNLGWDAACIRICTWGRFRDKRTKKKFYYFNLHMDHVGIVARRESAKLVVKKICEIAGDAPVILTGDFNVDQNNEIYSIFTSSGVLKDSYTSARLRYAENGTFNDYNSNGYTDSRIDHVFVSPSLAVDNYAMLTDCYWTRPDTAGKRKAADAPQEIDFQPAVRRLPSDHYPVFVKLKY